MNLWGNVGRFAYHIGPPHHQIRVCSYPANRADECDGKESFPAWRSCVG